MYLSSSLAFPLCAAHTSTYTSAIFAPLYLANINADASANSSSFRVAYARTYAAPIFCAFHSAYANTDASAIAGALLDAFARIYAGAIYTFLAAPPNT